MKKDKSIKRLVIHTKDVMIITGKSERFARTLIHQVRLDLEKQPHQMVTIRELSEYLGLDPDEVYSVIY